MVIEEQITHVVIVAPWEEWGIDSLEWVISMHCKTLQLRLHTHVRERFFMRNMLNVQYRYVDKQQIKHVNLIAHATFFHFSSLYFFLLFLLWKCSGKFLFSCFICSLIVSDLVGKLYIEWRILWNGKGKTSRLFKFWTEYYLQQQQHTNTLYYQNKETLSNKKR